MTLERTINRIVFLFVGTIFNENFRIFLLLPSLNLPPFVVIKRIIFHFAIFNGKLRSCFCGGGTIVAIIRLIAAALIPLVPVRQLQRRYIASYRCSLCFSFRSFVSLKAQASHLQPREAPRWAMLHCKLECFHPPKA